MTRTEFCLQITVYQKTVKVLSQRTLNLTNFEAWSTFKNSKTLKVFSRIHVLRGLHLFGQSKVFQRGELLLDFPWAPHIPQTCFQIDPTSLIIITVY